MAKHTPRTIWKPQTGAALQVVDTTAPQIAFFTSLQNVDADASMGLQIKRLDMVISMGLKHTGTLDNAHAVLGFMGFFKWPSDAATPTITTIDLDNRTAIWGRTLFSVQGTTPVRYRMKFKSARLTLGQELWCFLSKKQETDVGITLHTEARWNLWTTQA